MKRHIWNRFLLLLGGLALIAGGLTVAACARGWESWPPGGADGPVLGADRTGRLTGWDWWWWVAFGVPGLVLVLALWWLLPQFGRRAVRTLPVRVTGPGAGDGPSGLGTGFGMVGDDADTLTVSGHALAAAIEDDLATVPGVEHATARLVRRRKGPRLHLLVRAEAGAEPREVLGAVRDVVLVNGRESVGLDRLPTEMTLRTARGLPKRHLE